VADGMGGQEAGRLASHTTLEGVARCMNFLSDTEEATIPYGLSADMLQKPKLACITHFANFAVHQKSEGRNMGSTLIAAHFTDKDLEFVHVGDSRLYLFRSGELTQLTEDHSLVYELYKMGKLTLEEMHSHNMRNIITRAIGTHPQVNPSLGAIDIRQGDIFLLCSDGLTTMLDTSEIATILSRPTDSAAMAATLVDRANEAGGRDNITTVVIAVRQEL
jgi:protein phosphatase